MIPLVFTIVIALLVAGFICWIVSVLPFVPPPLKQIVQGVILFVTLLWLLYTLYGAFVGAPIRRGLL
jgi:cobalamin biosynthesis protein CobD/CbiB